MIPSYCTPSLTITVHRRGVRTVMFFQTPHVSRGGSWEQKSHRVVQPPLGMSRDASIAILPIQARR